MFKPCVVYFVYTSSEKSSISNKKEGEFIFWALWGESQEQLVFLEMVCI
jgi:hypothetical protein